MEAAKLQTAISSLLECGICLEVYKDPRMLPCGHTFCITCIRRSSQDSCALCKRQLAGVVIDELPRNYVVESFITSLPSSVICSLCDGRGAEAGAIEYFCIDCWDPLCATCSDGHRRFSKQAKNHIIKRIADVSQSDVEEHNRKMTSQCAEHSGQEMILYCKQCEQAVCSACCIVSHADHMTKCANIAEVDNTFVESIHHLIDEAQNIERHCDHQISRVTCFSENLVTLRDRTIADIQQFVSNSKCQMQSAFDDAMKSIDDMGQKIIGVAKLKFEEKQTTLESLAEMTVSNKRKAHAFIEPLHKRLPPLSSAVERAAFSKNAMKDLPKCSRDMVCLDQVAGVNVDILVSAWKNRFGGHLTPALIALQSVTLVSELTLDSVTADGNPETAGKVGTSATSGPLTMNFTTSEAGSQTSVAKYSSPAKRLSLMQNVWSISVRFLIETVAAQGNISYRMAAKKMKLIVHCLGVKKSIWEFERLRNGGDFALVRSCKYIIHSAGYKLSGEVVYIGKSDSCSNTPSYKLGTIPGVTVDLHYVPEYLHVSYDGNAYVIDTDGTVHVHAGMTMAETQCSSFLRIEQIIKMKNELFIALYWFRSAWELGTFQMPIRTKTTWKKPVSLDPKSCCLAYDGNENVFLSDKATSSVHMWSSDGEYKGALLTQDNISEPCCLAASIEDSGCFVLYVGQSNGEVKVFKSNHAL